VGAHAGPDINEDGLVLALDGGNLKSFRGVNATNLSPVINYNQSNQNSALFKLTNGEENVYIPSLGYVTSKYVDIYNDYNGGSGACCPALFSYGGIAVSPSTTYTYSIIYKTSTGYTSSNYMYRYEYAPAGYVTEAGVHSTNNRTSLGDGWWFAWGQFTTSATTTTLSTYLFHYEYATQNRVYVYRAAIYQGTYVIPPEHMLTSGQVRGTTVATGGGCIDLSDKGNNGSLVNGVSYTSSNGGSLVFDGVDDVISLGNPSSLNFGTGNFTLIFSTYLTAYGFQGGGYVSKGDGTSLGFDFRDTNFYVHGSSGLIAQMGFSAGQNVWQNHSIVFDRSSSPYVKYYRNGSLYATSTTNNSANINSSINTGRNFEIGRSQAGGVNRYFNGRISSVSMFNRALTADEIKQNFNATRGRFGI
jgi:hypothetical protein